MSLACASSDVSGLAKAGAAASAALVARNPLRDIIGRPAVGIVPSKPPRRSRTSPVFSDTILAGRLDQASGIVIGGVTADSSIWIVDGWLSG